MSRTRLTVGELIEQLKRFDPALPVSMAMNMEYEGGVYSDYLEVSSNSQGEYLLINDCPGAVWDEDGQPDEVAEWHSFDPDC